MSAESPNNIKNQEDRSDRPAPREGGHPPQQSHKRSRDDPKGDREQRYSKEAKKTQGMPVQRLGPLTGQGAYERPPQTACRAIDPGEKFEGAAEWEQENEFVYGRLK